MNRNNLSNIRGIVKNNNTRINEHYDEFEKITKKLKTEILISFDEILLKPNHKRNYTIEKIWKKEGIINKSGWNPNFCVLIGLRSDGKKLPLIVFSNYFKKDPYKPFRNNKIVGPLFN